MSTKLLVQQTTISGTPVVATAMTSAGGAQYTDAISVAESDGFASILCVTSTSTTLDFEVSLDGSDFYVPYDSSGSDVSSIFATVTADRYQAFDTQLAPYIRFKITPVANATVSLYFIQKEIS